MRALFILDNGNGTVRVEKEASWNSPNNKPNQLAKFDIDKDVLPTIPEGVEYLAWDGSGLVEASQAVQDAITDAEDAEAQEIHDADAPRHSLENWSKHEEFLLLIYYKLMKIHYPNMTKAQFFNTIGDEWESVKRHGRAGNRKNN